ncbi:MAG: putative manganese transporter [Bacteroidales bacterium]|nr:putative manganese transporter [Bacteroidales bacterium]
MEIIHALYEALLNSILITGLVVIMMMMIECFNIESHGDFFTGLRRSRTGQVLTGALLGIIPGCMGGFAVVSLYTHRLISFGALVAMMIASSGDEAFVMLAMFPDKALWIMLLLFCLGIACGFVTDFIHDRRHRRHCSKENHTDCGEKVACSDGYEVHSCDCGVNHEAHAHKGRHFGVKRLLLFLGVAIFIGALAGGLLEHSHGAEHAEEAVSEGISLLSEDWMNIFFSVLGGVFLLVLIFASDHFVEDHLWNHIIRKHLLRVFLWTLGVLSALGIAMQFIDLSAWISSHSGITALMIVIATLIGIIPESGPHLVFISLFSLYLSSPELDWMQFLPVLLASCISQDGHASIPLLAESKAGFLKAKAVNCAVALAVGFGSWGLISIL